MKFINYLEKITGVDGYALAAFMIFFFFFIVITAWAIKADKKLIDVLSNLPLEEKNV